MFAALSAGALDPAAFNAGAGLIEAQDATDRILYDTTTGALYYDADGTAGEPAIHFAVLGITTHPALAAADFAVA